MARKPSCLCGTCRTCYMRRARQRFYARNREAINASERKKRVDAPVTDAEMDRLALAWLTDHPWPRATTRESRSTSDIPSSWPAFSAAMEDHGPCNMGKLKPFVSRPTH